MTGARDDVTTVVVASRSFSANQILRSELLERYSRVTFNDAGKSLAGAELVEFLRGHERAVIALEKIDDALLAQLPDLRVISKYGVGLNNLDLAAMSRRGVKLGWKAGVNSQSVAELTIALMLILLRRLHTANDEVRAGGWRQIQGAELNSRTVGVIGLGHVGKKVAALLRAFGCTVLANDIVDIAEYCGTHGVRSVSLDELVASSDIITVHVPLNAGTRNLLDSNRLARAKPGVLIVNTARGGIVDEAAVGEMLRSGHIAGAAFDVFDVEPPSAPELITHPSVFATPHIGGSSREAVLGMGRAAIEGLASATDAAHFID